jgi:hypothetical protein
MGALKVWFWMLVGAVVIGLMLQNVLSVLY